MTVRSKIVGIDRQSPEDAQSTEEVGASAISFGEEKAADASLLELSETDEASEYDTQYDDEYASPRSNWKSYVAPVLLTLLFAGWTGFFAWTYQAELLTLTPKNAIGLIGNWALPASLIGIIWLLILRSSRSEAARFTDAAVKLRNESDALEQRMRTVNEEIAMAREFLAQNALELESVGRRAAANLVEASGKLSQALHDSDAKAKTLETVSNAATNNLEQLRKHLPVVTSAAKDVTNQIGNAGNSAQMQVKALIAALEQVAAAGNEARGNIDGMEHRAAEAAMQLTQLIDQNRDKLTQSVGEAREQAQLISAVLTTSNQEISSSLDAAIARLSGAAQQSAAHVSEVVDGQTQQMEQRLGDAANALSTGLDDRSADLARKLDDSAKDIAARIEGSSSEVDLFVERNIAKLTQQVEMLRSSLEEMAAQSAGEDKRIDDMIERMTRNLDQRAEQLALIDEAATDRSVKLAFSLEALVESTQQLNLELKGSEGTAADLVERSERFLLAIDTANRELEENLPTALSRADDHIAKSLTRLDETAAKAAALDAHNDNMLAKLATIDHLLSAQQDSVNALLSGSDAVFAERKEQAEALSASLQDTRSIMSEIMSASTENLSDTLERLKQDARNAADESRKTLEAEMADVADRLSQDSAAALKTAIDAQVASLNDMVRQSLENSFNQSSTATQQLSQQLAQIDDMTSSLERRLSHAKDSFEGIDDDSFARQMALLTESLNSIAIDVAKILSNEVTDTSWAAYLKGDRGVFTRRAVKLLSAGEVKMILAHYDEEPEFREHVNRYIHDFEAMMRVLLSTRDGNAIGVTLLSSDVGKLYVALAQAIERLRTD
ncbi:hypothetical protein ACFOWX_07145 [Sphingorhabdus arenilitoris]|uniref:ATPase n=1 Tax=Sphingorhabdus arenilitoris TaxID=1490041 RepID=A0ABV8RFN5_9SPHN